MADSTGVVLLILIGLLLGLVLAVQLMLTRRRRCQVAELIARLRALEADRRTLCEETTRLRTENDALQDAKGQALDQRTQLVLAAASTASGLTSRALRDVLELAMEKVGVELLDPAGQPFDARIQRQLRSVPASDPTQHGIVAETIRRGYRDAGGLLRPADVAVYEREAPMTNASPPPRKEG